MSNNIDNINNNVINHAQIANTGSADKKNNPGTTNTNAKDSNDTLSITNSAVLLNKLEKTLEATPVVDKDKVAAIKENLNSGNYSINAQAVAKKFTLFESILANAS